MENIYTYFLLQKWFIVVCTFINKFLWIFKSPSFNLTVIFLYLLTEILFVLFFSRTSFDSYDYYLYIPWVIPYHFILMKLTLYFQPKFSLQSTCSFSFIGDTIATLLPRSSFWLDKSRSSWISLFDSLMSRRISPGRIK